MFQSDTKVILTYLLHIHILLTILSYIWLLNKYKNFKILHYVSTKWRQNQQVAYQER